MEESIKAKEYFDQGLFDYSRLEFDSAIANFDEVIKINPNFRNGEAYLFSGLSYLEKRTFSKANNNIKKAKSMGCEDEIKTIEKYKDVLQVDEFKLDQLLKRASTAFDGTEFNLVILYSNKAINVDPNCKSAYDYRGMAYQAMDKHEEAITEYNKSIKIDPNDDVSYFVRGREYRDIGKNEEAIADFTKAIEINPKDVKYYLSRGNLYYKKEDFGKALHDMLKAKKYGCGNKDYVFDKEFLELDKLIKNIRQAIKEQKELEDLEMQFTDKKDKGVKRDTIPENVRIAVWRRDGGECVKCGSRENIEYDHIIPVSKGGSNTARNIELLCETCNRKKKDRIG